MSEKTLDVLGLNKIYRGHVPPHCVKIINFGRHIDGIEAVAAHVQKLADERTIETNLGAYDNGFKAGASHARKEALMTRNLPFDAFVVRHGGDGFGSEIVVGRDAANRAFAKLHSDDETDEMYEVYLKMAQDDDNWHFGADGEISDLTVDHECGWADIRRITLPAPITSELSKP